MFEACNLLPRPHCKRYAGTGDIDAFTPIEKVHKTGTGARATGDCSWCE
jgi:hypothetical protein